MGPLPQDTRLLVKYGGNNDGEPYALGETPAPQVVFCSERAQGAGGAAAEEAAAGQPAHAAGGKARTEGGAGQADAESPEGQGPDGVYSLYCRLYTQGPARIDVTASGYVAIEDRDLTLGKKSCLVDIELELTPLPLLLPDAGS